MGSSVFDELCDDKCNDDSERRRVELRSAADVDIGPHVSSSFALVVLSFANSRGVSNIVARRAAIIFARFLNSPLDDSNAERELSVKLSATERPKVMSD